MKREEKQKTGFFVTFSIYIFLGAFLKKLITVPPDGVMASIT